MKSFKQAMKCPVKLLRIATIAVVGWAGVMTIPAIAQFGNSLPTDNAPPGGPQDVSLPSCLDGKIADEGVTIGQVLQHCSKDASSDNERFLKKIRPVFLQQANQMADSGQLVAAEDAFGKLAILYPDDALVQYKLGEVQYRQGKPEAAILAYQTAIQKNANYAVAYNGIGQALASQQRFDEAIAAYEKALAINPNYADALMNFGYVLWKQGKASEAGSKLEAAKAIFQQQGRSARVQQIEKLLQEIRTTPSGVV